MAWNNSTTEVGLDFLSGMFGATPIVSRMAVGTSTLSVDEIYNLTDVVDYLKDGEIISYTHNAGTTLIRARVNNGGIASDTQIASVFIFADNGNGEDVLILGYSTTRPIPVDKPASPDGTPDWDYEPQLNLTFSNGQLVKAAIDWTAYAKLADVRVEVDVEKTRAIEVEAELKTAMEAHAVEMVYSFAGVHGFRIYEDKIQYKTSVASGWKTAAEIVVQRGLRRIYIDAQNLTAGAINNLQYKADQINNQIEEEM